MYTTKKNDTYETLDMSKWDTKTNVKKEKKKMEKGKQI